MKKIFYVDYFRFLWLKSAIIFALVVFLESQFSLPLYYQNYLHTLPLRYALLISIAPQCLVLDKIKIS